MKLPDKLEHRLRRWLGENPGRWLPAGLFGGAAGACAVAWLAWGSADLLAGALCFPLQGVALGLLYLMATAGGYSFLSTLQHTVRALQYLRRPATDFYYEPPDEEFPELRMIGGPHPGCGLLLLAPIILFGGIVSLPWFWFALRTVPAGRLFIALGVGMPIGVLMARGEARRLRRDQTSRRD